MAPTRCSALVNGRPCQAFAVHNSSFCWFHSPKPKKSSSTSIIDTLLDPKAFAPAFPKLETWSSWLVFLKGLYGLPMDENELAIFRVFTGRQVPNPEGYAEAYAVVGRRGGKSRISATIGAYEAIFGNWEARLSKGERGWIFIIATDRAQSQVVLSYLRSLINVFPGIKEREGTEEIHLSSGISIGVKTCSFRGTRGFSTIGVVADEIAFWRDAETAANPASEVIASLLPGLMPGAKLLAISTPYAKFGYLYEMHKAHFGQDSDILIWQAPTLAMNPTYSEQTIKRLVARDPSVFRAEYDATFREDVEAFLPEALIRAAMTRRQSLPDPRVRYTAFIDPSGGRQDSMTMAIVHREGEKIVLDRVEEKPAPFDPAQVVQDFAGLLKAFRVHSVGSDRFGGVWVEDAFRKLGVHVEMSDHSASELYLEFQPLLSMAKVELVQDERLALQFQCLERRTRSGGKDLVDHPPGGHDDIANAVAGAVVLAAKGQVWDEKEQEARLPVTQKKCPPYYDPKRFQRAEDIRAAEEEMRDFMGGSRIVRH
jgi:hypothetical protein